ncbi:hypothetical protein HU200_028830 [Digitaria exilis]|uniref:Uncharacterized protein n=1 Tax=Digitaria exilis TaxID=1010633 RepID=A0A835ESV1_9POAL|nr:hypothetical protein HU200_028830 [Digitaria exilis]
MSSLLADKISKDEWNRVLTAIGHTLAKDPDAGSMTKILSLSYFDLPQHLRSCFLYLSVFPEDYNINKQRLINRWIAEGFIEEEQSRSAYEIGEIYFNELINRSLIQPYKLKYGKARACRVHDIILDFITCKAAEENFVTSMDTVEHGLISDCRVRRLCIDNRDEEKAKTSAGLTPSHVRSLTIFGHFAQTSLSAFTALRVLDLEDCINFQDHHLTNIEKAYNLKYLCLRSYTIAEIPRKIGFLQFLETLDIRATKIVELPLTITELQRLARLYIDPCTRFSNGIIGQMKSLEELQEFGVNSYELGKSLQEFSQLTKLRTLVVSWNFDWTDDSEGRSLAKNLQDYVGTLVSSCNLHHLYVLENHRDIPMLHPLSLDSWSPAASCSLRKLHITYCFIYNIPNWMCSLENLKELKLYISCMRPEDVDILGEIPTLTFLELTAWYGANGRILIDGNNGFRNLKYFSLYMLYCGTALEFEVGSMPKLEHLQIRIPVHKIECLNGSFDLGIQHLSTLIKVEVTIVGDFRYYSTDNMSTDMDNGIIKCVEGSIKAAVESLPSSPILKFRTHYYDCPHFEEFLEFVSSYNNFSY